MNDQIRMALQRKVDEIAASGVVDVETQRSAVKEELHFYVLNFVYHDPEYSNWVMYGGSALRICHDLDRMSVDLDFEVQHPVTTTFLESLRADLETHFKETYDSGPDFLTTKVITERGILLRFHIGRELGIPHPSDQIHVKIELDHFEAPSTAVDRRPINHQQLSFVIRMHTMSTLMASKIAAVFLRGPRGVGRATYEGKGRDIYDLLWYMGKKIVPNLGYLRAKGIDAKDVRAVFNDLTLHMNKIQEENLRQDLAPLFLNRSYIEHWLQNWRESFLRLVDNYEIHGVTAPTSVRVQQEFQTDIYYFGFIYGTDDGKSVRFVFALSDYWVTFGPADLGIDVDPKLASLLSIGRDFASSQRMPEDLLKQYATLFSSKVERYLDSTNRIVLGSEVRTKLIRMTADKLNQKEQILLNMSTLRTCSLEDLLK